MIKYHWCLSHLDEAVPWADYPDYAISPADILDYPIQKGPGWQFLCFSHPVPVPQLSSGSWQDITWDAPASAQFLNNAENEVRKVELKLRAHRNYQGIIFLEPAKSH